MAVYFFSEKNRRSSNEDSFCSLEFRLNHEAAVHVMAVADGMGGLSGGKIYSDTAVKLLYQKLLAVIMDEEFGGNSLTEQTGILKDFLERVFQEINQDLYTRGLNAGMKGGTTLSVVIHFWDCLLVANCGDSPVYCCKDGSLELLSDIQNAAVRMVKEGRAKEGSLLFHQNKSRLVQYLGMRTPVTPHVAAIRDREADCLILGTDGAFGDLSREEIARILGGDGSGQTRLEALFEAAREKGEEDNQTAIFYRSKARTSSGTISSGTSSGTSSGISYRTGSGTSSGTVSGTGQQDQPAVTVEKVTEWSKTLLSENLSLEVGVRTRAASGIRIDEAVPGDYQQMESRRNSLRDRLREYWSSGKRDD